MMSAIRSGRGRKSGELAMAVRLRTPQPAATNIAVELPLWPTKMIRKKEKLLGSVPVGETHSH
jgi:hypothetical protein